MTGINNTIIGANVTGLAAGLSNNIIIADGSGNQRINVGSTGNVGIGTTSPASRLYVSGDGTTGNLNLLTLDNGGGTGGVGIRFISYNANVATNDLISTSYTGGLEVNTGSGFTIGRNVSNNPNGASTLLDVGGSVAIGSTYGNGSNSAPTDGLIVQGNVGIGTTSPATTLSVAGNAYLTGGLGVGAFNPNPGSLLTSGGATITGGIDLIHSGIARVGTISNDTSGFILENTSANPIIFQTNGANERMRIDASGNVGIGTTTPGSLLSISGTSGLLASTTATSTFQGGGINLITAAGNTGCFAVNGTCIGGGGGGSGTVSSGTTGQFPYYAANGTTLTATSSLFLASSGNVGIGTTLPTQALTVNGNVALLPANSTITGSTGLTLQETGDVYGTVSLSLQNRNGMNGALFSNPSLDLVDFAFNPQSGVQQNIRYEHRAAQILGAGNTGGEFQIGPAGSPNFIIGAGTTAVQAGNFGVGIANPTAKLQVSNGTLLIDNASPVSSITLSNSSVIKTQIAQAFASNNWAPGSVAGDTIIRGNGNNILFSTDNGLTTQLYLRNGGSIGIGTTTPWGQLSVNPNGIAGPAFVIGSSTATSLIVTNGGNVGIGNSAPATRLDITNSANSAAAITLRDSSGAISLELRTGTSTDQNTFIGYQAAPINVSGTQNTALGYQTLYANTTGFYNTALGYQSLYSNTTGYDNIALGYQALYSNTTGTSNTATGWGTLYFNTSGTSNTATGYYAMQNNTTGYNNTSHLYKSVADDEKD